MHAKQSTVVFLTGSVVQKKQQPGNTQKSFSGLNTLVLEQTESLPNDYINETHNNKLYSHTFYGDSHGLFRPD